MRCEYLSHGRRNSSCMLIIQSRLEFVHWFEGLYGRLLDLVVRRLNWLASKGMVTILGG